MMSVWSGGNRGSWPGHNILRVKLILVRPPGLTPFLFLNAIELITASLRMCPLARYRVFTSMSGQVMSIVWQPYQSHHFEDYLALVSDEKVMAMITEYGFSRSEAEIAFAHVLQDNQHHPRLGHFRVADADTGVYLGLGKLVVKHNDAAEAELGYMLRPACWGQGWGSRMATALVEEARNLPQLQRLVAIIDPKHSASRRILVKQGFVTTSIGTLEGLPAETLHLVL